MRWQILSANTSPLPKWLRDKGESSSIVAVMKSGYLPAVCSFLVLFATVPVHADWVEDAVKDIRAKYSQIEGWKRQTQSITFEPDEPFSAKLTRHTYQGQTVRIDLEHGGEHGYVTEYHYYHNGQLFFTYRSDGSWRFTGRQLADGNSETVDTLTEYRIYFKDGQPIRLLRKHVESTNPDALGGMVRKQANQAYSDPQLVAETQQRGVQAANVWNPGALGALFGF